VVLSLSIAPPAVPGGLCLGRRR